MRGDQDIELADGNTLFRQPATDSPELECGELVKDGHLDRLDHRGLHRPDIGHEPRTRVQCGDDRLGHLAHRHGDEDELGSQGVELGLELVERALAAHAGIERS